MSIINQSKVLVILLIVLVILVVVWVLLVQVRHLYCLLACGFYCWLALYSIDWGDWFLGTGATLRGGAVARFSFNNILSNSIL